MNEDTKRVEAHVTLSYKCTMMAEHIQKLEAKVKQLETEGNVELLEEVKRLRAQHAADEEYIAELEEAQSLKEKEEAIRVLTEQNQNLKNENRRIMDKYSLTVSQITDATIEKLREKNKALEAENAKLKDIRDSLIARMS